MFFLGINIVVGKVLGIVVIIGVSIEIGKI